MNSKDWSGNSHAIYTTLGASNHAIEDREENDYYATDPLAIDKLYKTGELNNCKMIWEPACGEGHLSKRLKELGFNVISSDIIDRGYEGTIIKDFLSRNETGVFTGDILTNPPYKYAKEFVLKALDNIITGNKVFMFLKLTFLEGQARYNELFSKYPPKTVYVFSQRIPCAKNGKFDSFPSSAVAYAWFVWEKGFTGETVVKWI